MASSSTPPQPHGSTSDSLTYCWGNTSDGELGLGGVEQEQLPLPQELDTLRGRPVSAVGCGASHTVFLIEGGELYSCGNNDVGQLGHKKPNLKRPESIGGPLERQVVVGVDCGAVHSLAVTDTGQTFAWGSNEHGQLGRGTTEEHYFSTPKLVKSLATRHVVAVTCGDNHCMALTNAGRLFAWGENTHGQLGLGCFSAKMDTPQQVSSLDGVPLEQIQAGGQHSLAITVSCGLYCWGRNNYGQLGVGDQSDRFYPAQVKTLRNLGVRHVDAGEAHTVALTLEGGVFTFGNGSQGQLGHNTTRHEVNPRQVVELMGSVVTQLAAGRRHTLAYVPSSGRIYAFGLGGSGQLGTGEYYSRLSPTAVQGPFVSVRPSSAFPNLKPITDVPPYVVSRIYGGGDHSFTTTTSLKCAKAPDDFRVVDPRTQIWNLSPERIDTLVSVPSQIRPPLELIEDMKTVFSSKACLNASFLLPDNKHCGCNAKNHGLNFELACDTFRRIASLPSKILLNEICGVIKQDLIPSLTGTPPAVEAMRILLILPCCHLFDNPQYYSSVQCPFARVFTSLKGAAAEVLSAWLSQLTPEHFGRLVTMYKAVIVCILFLPIPGREELQNRQMWLRFCLEMLAKLKDVNLKAGYIISFESFYIPELKERLDIPTDYANWIHQAGRQQSERDLGMLLSKRPKLHHDYGNVLSFCNYPFVFDGQAKTILLHTDASLQMRSAIDEVCRRNLTSLIIPDIDPINPCLLLYVTRQHIVQDTIGQLTKYGSCDFKKPLKVMFQEEEAVDAGGVKKVIFLGEEAVDEGGVVKEFFLLIIREILDPKYGMFQYYEESRLSWFNRETFEDPKMFTLIGVLCGLAIYNAIIIDLKFPLALFKKLLGQQATLDDLVELDPVVGRSLKELLKYEESNVEDVFSLTFEITRERYGEMQSVELKPGGADIAVTAENRQEYVDAYIDYTFNQATREQFLAFNEGFHKVCGGGVLSLFHPKELQAMVVGNENYDWEVLETNCQYKGGYHQNSETIRFFWEVFQEMSLEDKKKFLRFLTGSDRIPIHGMKAIKMFIQPMGSNEEHLPVAHTCFNLLDLPPYRSKDGLRRKLLTAIQQTEGFGIV